MDTVGEVMSRDVVCVQETTTLGSVARSLRAADASVALVLDGFGDVVGIVTERELVDAVAASRHPDIGTAQSWMRRDFVVIPSTSSLADADSMMRAGEFRELPVMDAGTLVGIVVLERRRAAARGLTRGATAPGGSGTGGPGRTRRLTACSRARLEPNQAWRQLVSSGSM